MRAATRFAGYAAVSFILLFALSAFSQTNTGGGTGGSTGGSTGGTNSTRSTPNVNAPNRTQSPQEQRRPVYLSGRVMLDDGTPPPERASIERVCNGRARREGYADTQGHFAVQLGTEQYVFQDASVGTYDNSFGAVPGVGTNSGVPGISPAAGSPNTGVSSAELMTCELRASLPGFRSDVIILAGRQLFDNPDVGTIVLHRLGKVEGTSVSVTTLKAPKDARKAYERGINELKKQKREQAAKEFDKAIALYPKFADAMVLLGEIRNAEERSEEATKLFQQAMEADPQLLQPYFDLALLAGRNQDWKRMAELSERALALDAYQYPISYYLNAVANYNLQKLEVSEKNARMALRLDSQHHIPRIDLILANILLRRNDYAGAAEQLRTFLKYVPAGQEADMARKMLGDTESRLAAVPVAENPK